MISTNQAISYAEHKYRDKKFTGFGYFYDGDYYIELGTLDYNPRKDGPLIDSMFKIDGETGQVSSYAPLIDGFHNIRRIKKLQ